MSTLPATARRALVGAHLLCLAALLALTAAGVVPPAVGWLLVSSLGLAALYHTAAAVWETRRRRAEADRLLAAIDVDRVPEPLRWRAEELTAVRQRRALARALANLLRSLELPPSAFPVPVNRHALHVNRRTIEALVSRLRAFDRPVRVRGILLIRDLLGDGLRSPLYETDRNDAELRAALVRVRSEIEPRSSVR